MESRKRVAGRIANDRRGVEGRSADLKYFWSNSKWLVRRPVGRKESKSWRANERVGRLGGRGKGEEAEKEEKRRNKRRWKPRRKKPIATRVGASQRLGLIGPRVDRWTLDSRWRHFSSFRWRPFRARRALRAESLEIVRDAICIFVKVTNEKFRCTTAAAGSTQSSD